MSLILTIITILTLINSLVILFVLYFAYKSYKKIRKPFDMMSNMFGNEDKFTPIESLEPEYIGENIEDGEDISSK